MCEVCIHNPVCSRFIATGGYVKECRHWKHEARLREEWENMKADNERLKRMLDNAYEIIGKMTDRYC